MRKNPQFKLLENRRRKKYYWEHREEELRKKREKKIKDNKRCMDCNKLINKRYKRCSSCHMKNIWKYKKKEEKNG